MKLQPVKCKIMMQKLQSRLLSAVLVQYSPSLRLFLAFTGHFKRKHYCGVHASVAVKACGLAYRGGVTPDVVMSGGVAQNAGVVRAISKELKQQVIVAPHPQVAGALGAALYAYEDALKAMKK